MILFFGVQSLRGSKSLRFKEVKKFKARLLGLPSVVRLRSLTKVEAHLLNQGLLENKIFKPDRFGKPVGFKYKVKMTLLLHSFWGIRNFNTLYQ